ncbi:pseudaminic acid cytidylyltransferase [Bradyrhizobium sp. CB2312]|uniref:pseudaminic acid cytidylyltransferase n=1 Tax=Bradyrhizobium sp. CB2312 TaxID=3039155 RepID=UPI0024B1B3B3|nr:pseudaminic acid cytidylyltransferase [Bradyrhizobium sp. CB2312]WFU75677.1 pseudaminic acid cytidylyltransferase [Bradyrhizobium sp. CB2312]
MAEPGSDPCGEGECSRSFRFDGGAEASHEIIFQGALGVTLPTILAVIPARGGSKRIPRKNITLFHGKPMMAWPIGMLKSSGLVATILVSTDNEEVAEVARNIGAEVPFMRPASLSDDYTGTAAVTKHAVDWFVSNRCRPDLILTVYPTAVFVSADDIKSAVDAIERLNCEMVFSAVEFPSRIQRALFMNDDGRVRMAHPEYYSARSQDLPTAYHDAGQFYLSKTETALAGASYDVVSSAILPVPRDTAVDIDTPEDLEIAERIFQYRLRGTR